MVLRRGVKHVFDVGHILVLLGVYVLALSVETVLAAVRSGYGRLKTASGRGVAEFREG